jgi:hypothetical protein
MGFLAERAATRLEARQRYRTAARMQRRRSWIESKLGKRQDFEPKEEERAQATPVATAPPSTSAVPEPGYVAELERLAQLRDEGIVSEEEFAAKKKQLLGI